MWWLATGVTIVAMLGLYVTWLATRLERLHQREADAGLALAGKLSQRAQLALTLSEKHSADLGRHVEALRVTAYATLDAVPLERETAENDLTNVFRALPLPENDPCWAEINTANRKVAIAKQVHTDVVRDVLALRGRRLTRLVGLGRKIDQPRYFNMDNPMLSSYGRDIDRQFIFDGEVGLVPELLDAIGEPVNTFASDDVIEDPADWQPLS